MGTYVSMHVYEQLLFCGQHPLIRTFVQFFECGSHARSKALRMNGSSPWWISRPQDRASQLCRFGNRPAVVRWARCEKERRMRTSLNDENELWNDRWVRFVHSRPDRPSSLLAVFDDEHDLLPDLARATRAREPSPYCFLHTTGLHPACKFHLILVLLIAYRIR